MRKTQKKHRKLLQLAENCIIIEINPNNVKQVIIELSSATPSDQSDLFVFNNGHAYDKNTKDNISYKETKGVVKDRKMESINIFDAARFLVQLYYKTDSKYSCTRTKLEKLLAIANLVSMAKEDVLFNNDIHINPCGVGIYDMATFAYSDIIIGEDISKEISSNEFVKKVFPSGYDLIEELPIVSRKLLTKVFCRFGAYSARDLGSMFDEFKFIISIKNEVTGEEVVDKNKFIEYITNKSNNSKYEENEIIDFIIRNA